ncbi:MAG: glycosyltransferase [Verrucomicrobia bacterium]|nr:MAG: glycosyltransferase [Verrucomicrobiota bacterium]
MKISVIIPSYNQGRFLVDCVESLVSQQLNLGTTVEILIFDGGSKDTTQETIKPYLEKYSNVCFFSEQDRGQSNAINKGFRKATGNIICWLNCDDYFLPGALACVARHFHAYPHLQWLYGDGVLVAEDKKTLGVFPASREYDQWVLVSLLDYIFQPSTFWRRTMIEKVGDLDETLNWGMDWDYFIRLGKVSTPHYVRQQLSAQRIYGSTKTATGGTKRLKELYRIMRRHGAPFFPPGLLHYSYLEFWPLAEKNLSQKTYARVMPWLDRIYKRILFPALLRWTHQTCPYKGD